jgi:hypothetical protein
MHKRKLPIAIQTFAQIREGDYYYVDKTDLALQLVDLGKYFFLSRPRRFGKSLFLDTLSELFRGNAALFQGLAAENQWDWGVKYPVIRISFSDGVLQSRAQLDQRIREILRVNRVRLRAPMPSGLEASDIAGNFSDLIEQAHIQSGQRAVVLIDEYDKPILDNISDTEIATEMREGLKNLYSVLKGSDANLKFVFLTGVSKFSKVSLFSGLNNLMDITLDPRFSTICGYTDRDIDTTFAPELPGLDREEVRRWYNGYNWLGEAVYNPYDVLLLFSSRTFKPYWFETGTPSFLVKILAQRPDIIPNLGQAMADGELLSCFDVDVIAPEALMFQSGYLTIEHEENHGGAIFYHLCYPNREVRQSLHNRLLEDLGSDRSKKIKIRIQLFELLKQHDLNGMQALFHAFFSSIPHQWYTNNPMAQYEGYYASIFYSYFAALGLNIAVEESTSVGRLDMALQFEGRVYIFEFKVVELEPEGRALQQIKDKRYADKYQAPGVPIFMIGVEFSKDTRNIVGFEVEQAG